MPDTQGVDSIDRGPSCQPAGARPGPESADLPSVPSFPFASTLTDGEGAKGDRGCLGRDDGEVQAQSSVMEPGPKHVRLQSEVGAVVGTGSSEVRKPGFGNVQLISPEARARLRRLVCAYSWPSALVRALHLAPRHWTCSSAFSGIGCAELGAAALSRACRGLRLDFVHGIERDPAARAMLACHAPASQRAGDILDVVPTDASVKDDLRRAAGRHARCATGRKCRAVVVFLQGWRLARCRAPVPGV